MRILIGSLAALLAMASTASAHYDGSHLWHDFGSDLGFLEDSPVGPMLPDGGATGICWYSESEFPVDLFHGPPHTHLGDILGHSYGVGAGQGCGGMVGGPACSEGAENPAVYVLVGTADTFPLVAFCHGASAEGLPGPPGVPPVEPPPLPTLPPEGLPPVEPPELPDPLGCIVAALDDVDPGASVQACLGGAPPVPEPPAEVPAEVA